MAALRSSELLYSAEKEFRFGPQAGHVNIPLRSSKISHYRHTRKKGKWRWPLTTKRLRGNAEIAALRDTRIRRVR
jgi:hypothetical protein